MLCMAFISLWTLVYSDQTKIGESMRYLFGLCLLNRRGTAQRILHFEEEFS